LTGAALKTIVINHSNKLDNEEVFDARKESTKKSDKLDFGHTSQHQKTREQNLQK